MNESKRQGSRHRSCCRTGKSWSGVGESRAQRLGELNVMGEPTQFSEVDEHALLLKGAGEGCPVVRLHVRLGVAAEGLIRTDHPTMRAVSSISSIGVWRETSGGPDALQPRSSSRVSHVRRGGWPDATLTATSSGIIGAWHKAEWGQARFDSLRRGTINHRGVDRTGSGIDIDDVTRRITAAMPRILSAPPGVSEGPTRLKGRRRATGAISSPCPYQDP